TRPRVLVSAPRRNILRCESSRSRGRDHQHARARALPRKALASFVEQFVLRSAYGRLEPELPIGVWQRHSSLRGPFDVTFHNQVRLIYFFERSRFLADCYGKRAQSHRATVELM